MASKGSTAARTFRHSNGEALLSSSDKQNGRSASSINDLVGLNGRSPHPSSAEVAENGSSSRGASAHSGYTNGYAKGAANGQANGYPNGLANGYSNGHSNGHTNGVTNGHVNGHVNLWLDSDDEGEDFVGAEERSCCSDSEFHDANDASDFSSDSEGFHTPLRPHTSHRALLARIHEEQSRCAALEAELEEERRKLKELTPSSKGGALELSRAAPPAALAQAEATCPPAPPVQKDEAKVNLEVARMVAEAVGRAAGKAEAELEATTVLQQKEKELARLREKLQYWERMNQEMSQQNTQAIEMLRQRRRVWKTIYRVTYVAGAVVLGIGILAAVNLVTSAGKELSPSSSHGDSGSSE